MNDVIINWKKVACYMGEHGNTNEDRGYTHEEILRVLNVSDLRLKVIVLLLASTGMRIGGLVDVDGHYMKVGDISETKVMVYARTAAKYVTYCTPECRKAIDEYLNYRKRSGEIVTPDSPLIRKHIIIEQHIDDRNKAHAYFYSKRPFVKKSSVSLPRLIETRFPQSKSKVLVSTESLTVRPPFIRAVIVMK